MQNVTRLTVDSLVEPKNQSPKVCFVRPKYPQKSVNFIISIFDYLCSGTPPALFNSTCRFHLFVELT